MSVEDAIDNSGPYWKDRGYNASPVADIINPERAISPAYGSGRVGKRVDNKNGRRKLADIVKYTTKKQASSDDRGTRAAVGAGLGGGLAAGAQSLSRELRIRAGKSVGKESFLPIAAGAAGGSLLALHKKHASARDTLLMKLAAIPEPDEQDEVIGYDSVESALENATDDSELIVPDGIYESTLPYDMYKECLTGFTDELVGLDKEAGLFDLAKRLAGRLGGAATAAKAPQSLLAKGLAAKRMGPVSTGLSAARKTLGEKVSPRTSFQQGRLADKGEFQWKG